MKQILILAGLHLALVSLAAPPPAGPGTTPPPTTPAATGQPRAVFSETAFDFGKVKSTESQSHDFIVTNTGNAVLKITAVQPGCGCTSAKPWDPEIMPGKSGRIPIQFNPANFSGSVSKGISVTCNDPANPVVALVVSANIWRPIDIQPQFASFLMVEGEETNETKVVRIVNNMDEDLILQTPQSSSPTFKAELKAVRPGKEFELHLQYAGALSNASSYANIGIATSVSNLPTLNVSATLIRQAAIVAMPQSIHLPNTSAGQKFSYPLIVRNNGRLPVRLSDPAVNVAGATARIEELEAGKSFRINLEFLPDFHVETGKAAELTVKTTHSRQPALKVPIYQLPQAPIVPAASGK